MKYRDKYYLPQKTSTSGLWFSVVLLNFSIANALPQCALNLGKNVVHQLTVSLEDLFNGATRKLAVQKNVICERCEGATLLHMLHCWLTLVLISPLLKGTDENDQCGNPKVIRLNSPVCSCMDWM